MLQRSTAEHLVQILKKDARRALKMHVPGFPKPYYCSFLLRDVHWFHTWASSGSTYRQSADRTRTVYCDLRVGSYDYDQVVDGGLTDNDEERDSFMHSTVPIDDRDYDGLRMTVWRLLEAKFREALTDFNDKEASRISTPDPNHGLRSFVRAKRANTRILKRVEKVEHERWGKFCKKASLWISQLPRLSASWVDFDATQETKVFVNTEGSIVVQNSQVFSLTATLRKLLRDGATITQELVINCGDLSELPDFSTFRELMLEKYQQLMRLARAKKIPAFSGPVLLASQPAGLLFHEAIGHRLEGSRLLSNGEGQTFKGQEGERILNVDITVRDNPNIKQYNGVRCIGAYQYDDEGTRAQDALLIENGILRGFLSTRAATAKRKFHPNGHARNKASQRPISRMGVTVVQSKVGQPFEALKAKLVEEIRRQKRPYGLIVYETSGGETDTTNYDFQAFSGMINYATLVYPNGKEVCVRGVNFVGTPLQALNNIIALGDDGVVDNSFCGAESGFIPVTTISPSVLFSNLELQGKDEELSTQYILARPKSRKNKLMLRKLKRRRSSRRC